VAGSKASMMRIWAVTRCRKATDYKGEVEGGDLRAEDASLEFIVFQYTEYTLSDMIGRLKSLL